MSPANDIKLRYRTAGHVRFQVPKRLCSPASRQSIVEGLHEIEGIYRVDFYSRQGKISIRFIESLCRGEDLSQHLNRLAAASEAAASCCGGANHAVATPPRPKASGFAPARWIREKLTASSGTAAGLGLLVRRAPGGVAVPWFNENTVIEFLNDALVLFLIKLHWHMITQHWLRQPWRYRYEWMAAFYLIYLLVRSRRPKKR